MKNPRITVFSGAILALAIMHVMASFFGYATTVIPRGQASTFSQGYIQFPDPMKIKLMGDYKVRKGRSRNWEGEGRGWGSNILSFPPFKV